MIEGREAGRGQRDMLGAGGAAEALKELGDARLGDVVLLNAGLDGVHILYFDIEVGVVVSQDGRQVVDLVVGELCIGHGFGSRPKLLLDSSNKRVVLCVSAKDFPSPISLSFLLVFSRFKVSDCVCAGIVGMKLAFGGAAQMN